MSVHIDPVTRTKENCQNHEGKANGKANDIFQNTRVRVCVPRSAGEHTGKTGSESAFSQLDKNTVSAAGQLKESSPVRFYHENAGGKRILIVGNSITLHLPSEAIGWYGQWGMAASCAEKDYVHQLMASAPGNAYCICQVAEWEREYKNGSAKLSLFENARDFETDIIIMRFVENCPKAGFDPEVFKKELDALLNYLDKSSEARIILTTGFLRHPGDTAIIEYAKEKDCPCVALGDLGEREEMKAIGLFDHKGVANHPGDLGMAHIAERIRKVLETYL